MFRKKISNAMSGVDESLEENEFKSKRKRPIWSCAAVRDFRFFYLRRHDSTATHSHSQIALGKCKRNRTLKRGWAVSWLRSLLPISITARSGDTSFLLLQSFRVFHIVCKRANERANFRQFQFESQQRASYYQCVASVPLNMRAQTHRFVYSWME